MSVHQSFSNWAASLGRRNKGMGKKMSQQVQRQRRRLLIEEMEGRRLLTATLSASLLGEDLIIGDTGAAINNDLTISLSGSNIVVSDANEEFVAAPVDWTLSPDSKSLSRPLAGFTGAIVIDAADGDDELTIDNTNGSIDTHIVFDGGAGTNSVVINGGSFESLSSNYGTDGQTTLEFFVEGPAGSVDVVNVGTIVIGVDSVSQVDIAPTGLSALSLADNGIVESGLLRLSANEVTTDFQIPSQSLSILGGSTDNAIVVGSLTGFTGNLSVGDTENAFDTVNFVGAIALSGDAGLTAYANNSIILSLGANLETEDGDIFLSANQGEASNGGNFIGINLIASTISATGLGNITLLGTGGNDPSGVQIGVQLTLSSEVLSNSGDILIDGQGGESTGNGNIGVSLAGAGTLVSSLIGSVSVSGNGGGSGSGSGSNHGVRVIGGGVITAGAGVTVEGNGGAVPSSENFGVTVLGAGSLITATGGIVSVTGNGGGVVDEAGATNIGVRVFNGAAIRGAGTVEAVLVTGVGGPSTLNGNAGVFVSRNNAEITSTSGYVVVDGTGGGSGNSNSNPGVSVSIGGEIESTLDQPLAVFAVGGNPSGTGTLNNGLFLATDGSISSQSSSVSITAQGTHTSEAMRISNGGSIITNGDEESSIIIEADSLAITGSPLGWINAAQGQIAIQPLTPGTPIVLLGADVLGSAGTLGLSQAELNQFIADSLSIGNSDSGSLTVASSYTRGTPTDVSLASGGAIVLNGSINTPSDPEPEDPEVRQRGNLFLAGETVIPTFVGVDATALSVTLVGTLEVAIPQPPAPSSVPLQVAGAVDLSDATLSVDSGATVLDGDETFTIVSATSITGEFIGLPDGVLVPVGAFNYVVRYTADKVQLVPARRRFDFNHTANVVTAAKFTSVLPTDLYSAEQGFGWNAAVNSIDRTGGLGTGGTPRDLFRDKHWSNISNRTFSVSAKPGETYSVTVHLGDIAARDVEISVGGSPFQRVSTVPREYVSPSILAVASSDRLVIQFRKIPSISWAVNGIEVLQIPNLPAFAPSYTDVGVASLASEQMTFSPMDVNQDGHVSPLDVLKVVNFLNARSNASKQFSEEEQIALDVDGSGAVTPLDVLLIINMLSRRSKGAAEGESDSSTDATTLSASSNVSDAHDNFFADYSDTLITKRRRL